MKKTLMFILLFTLFISSSISNYDTKIYAEENMKQKELIIEVEEKSHEVKSFMGQVVDKKKEIDTSKMSAMSSTRLFQGVVRHGSIGVAGECDGYYFIPEQTATYLIESSGSTDTLGYFFNCDGYFSTCNDNDGDDSNFQILFKMQAGKKYYLDVYHSSDTGTGDYSILVNKVQAHTISGTISFPNGEQLQDENGADLVVIAEGETKDYWREVDLSYKQNTISYTISVPYTSQPSKYKLQYYIRHTIKGYIDYGYYNTNETVGNCELSTTINGGTNNIYGINLKLRKDKIIDFPDQNLEDEIRETLEMTSADLHISDLEKIIRLYGDGKNISNLEGMQYLINIIYLDLDENNLSNINQLRNLIKLRVLWLGDNQITDISSLSKMTELRALDLSSNQISTITPIKNSTKLVHLFLNENTISNIDYLSNMNELEILLLPSNQISDINSLSNLTKLQELDLSFNEISDIAPLKNLANLSILYMSVNNISNINEIGYLTNIEELRLSDNNITDISPLSSLTKLRELELEDNQINIITPIERLTNLSELFLSINNISNIDSLENLTNLKRLWLEDNDINDINVLRNLSNLELLNLHDNNVSDISSLINMTNLKELYLYNNQICNFKPLGNLRSLNTLHIDGNQTIDYSPTAYYYNNLIEKDFELTMNGLVSVSIDNYINARPQSGLNDAKVVYETSVAPGITRFLAIYDINNTEDSITIGPVRSARKHFVELASGIGGGFAHAGGSAESLNLLPLASIVNLDEIYGSGNYFYRDINKNAPHNLYTTLRNLKDGMLNTANHIIEPKDLFRRGNITGGQEGKSAKVKYNGQSTDVQFIWNETNSCYDRYENNEYSTLENGERISADNVVVVYTDYESVYVENIKEWKEIPNVIGEGVAELYRDGQKWNGEWEKDNMYSNMRFTVNNDTMLLDEGNVWILIVDNSTFLPNDKPQVFIEEKIDNYYVNGVVKYNKPVEVNIKDEEDNLITSVPKFFYPDVDITRAQISQMICGMLEKESLYPIEVGYSDVDNNYWAAEYIAAIRSMRIFNGYTDGTFRPEENVTRAEIAKVLIIALGYEDLVEETPNFYNDTKGHWAEKYINFASALGIIIGDADLNFYPDKNATKAEAAVCFVKAMGLEDNLTDIQYFDDLDNHWASKYINTGFEHGLYNFYNEDTFRVNVNATGSAIIESTDNNGIKSEKTVFLNNSGFDINNDNRIDINDLAWLSQYYANKLNSHKQRYDLNNDGKINIYDFVLAARRLGR